VEENVIRSNNSQNTNSTDVGDDSSRFLKKGCKAVNRRGCGVVGGTSPKMRSTQGSRTSGKGITGKSTG